ncbi:hypothetical protein C3L33_15620, partial [Rhododendron williamsianum]
MFCSAWALVRAFSTLRHLGTTRQTIIVAFSLEGSLSLRLTLLGVLEDMGTEGALKIKADPAQPNSSELCGVTVAMIWHNVKEAFSLPYLFVHVQRVTRPEGGVNEWLHWLPVSLHKKLDYIIRQMYGYSRILLAGRGNKLHSLPFENGGSVGLSSVLEADVKKIATMAHKTFEKDGPLLVVASGRDTISVASAMKRLASENVFVVQIQHPRTHLNRFDMVITPHHDYYPLTPRAQEQVPRFLRKWITPREPPDRALHQVDAGALRTAASAWHDEFAPLPKPLLMISNLIVKEFGNHPKIYIWDGEEPNPHMGHLAWGDAFVVTADSVSMVSEACGTGKPVYVIGMERCTWKFVEFHKSLRERGLV